MSVVPIPISEELTKASCKLRERIIFQIRLLYCIIETHEGFGSPFSIDDVVKDFREALLGAASMTDVIEKSRIDFPFQQDLVSICRNFKKHFKFMFIQRNEVNKEICLNIS